MPPSILLWRDLDHLAHKVARHFGLGPVLVKPHGHPQARHFGKILIPPGRKEPAVIMLRVHQMGRPTVPLARRTILETLAHELAHLATYGHGPEHRERTREFLAWMEAQ